MTTVANKKFRHALASRLEALGAQFGIQTERENEQPENPFRQRSVTVTFHMPHGLTLSVELNGNSRQQRGGTHVLSWHGVEDGWRLNGLAFGSVNQFHGCKATDVCDTLSILDILESRFARIMAGDVFTPETREKVGGYFKQPNWRLLPSGAQ